MQKTLAGLGESEALLAVAVKGVEELLRESVALAQELYRSRYEFVGYDSAKLIDRCEISWDCAKGLPFLRSTQRAPKGLPWMKVIYEHDVAVHIAFSLRSDRYP